MRPMSRGARVATYICIVFFASTCRGKDSSEERVAMPTFSPPAGAYDKPIAVEISTETEGVTIFYTIDGSEPSAKHGKKYEGSVILDEDGLEATVKAIALKQGIPDSHVAEAGYTLDLTPRTPSVEFPEQGSKVASPFTIRGTAAAGNSIEATLVYRYDAIIRERVEVKADGTFELTVNYTQVDAGADLVLNVVQASGDYVSEPAIINLVGDVTWVLGGSVEQTSGPIRGDVHIWLYEAGQAGSTVRELSEPISSLRLDGPENSWVKEKPFEFRVPKGQYVLRSFRDAGASLDSRTPDGLPTLRSDAQSEMRAVTVGDRDVADVHLDLICTRDADMYHSFEVFTSNESCEPEPPWYNENGDWVRGEGLCRGYHMRLETSRNTKSDDLSKPKVRLPDGTIVALLDDGACGPEVADNTSGSYNRTRGDGAYSYGWPDPDESDVGAYTFFYENSAEGFFHIEERQLNEVERMPGLIPLTSPTGAKPNTDLQPKLEWEPLGDGVRYRVCLQKSQQSNWQICEVSEKPYIQLPFEDDLDDAQAYCATISAVRLCPLGRRLAATQGGVRSCFVTCSDPESDCMTVSGDIIDHTSMDSRYLIEVSSLQYGSLQSTVVLPPDAESYRAAVLRHDDKGLNVRATWDTDGSGSSRTTANEQFVQFVRVEPHHLEGIDIRFASLIQASFPREGKDQVGDQPTFKWEGYDQTYFEATGQELPLDDWMYVLTASQNMAAGFDIIWSLDKNVTSFDMTSPPEDSLDVQALLRDSSAEDLTVGSDWQWRLRVFDCHFQDMACLHNRNERDSVFADSGYIGFTTD